MIIQENQLRPPSPKEMAARRVPLERIRIDWTWSAVDSNYAFEFSTLELIELHKDWQIPYEAQLSADGWDNGETALDWTHLVKCETCNQWFLPDTDHTTTDALHLAKVRKMAKLLTGEDVMQ